MERLKLTIDEVLSEYKNEFGFLENKFTLCKGDTSWARASKEKFVSNPGVYVWWHPQHGVLRVGASMINSRKRALQHTAQDIIGTGKMIKPLSLDPKTMLLLFNIKDSKDSHWVPALEKYFEEKIHPEIPPKRRG